MGDTNEYTVHDLVRDELYKNMDVEYGKFIASLSLEGVSGWCKG